MTSNSMIPFGRSPFGGAFGSLDKLLFGDPNFLNPIRKVDGDGETKWEFNLAGYSASEIKVHIDTALHQLFVRADRSTPGDERHFATKISLPLRATHEDVFSSYENGMLSVIVKEPSVKENDTMIEIPVLDTPSVSSTGTETSSNTNDSAQHASSEEKVEVKDSSSAVN